MKKAILLFWAAFTFSSFNEAALARVPGVSGDKPAKAPCSRAGWMQPGITRSGPHKGMGSAPFCFIENKGQITDQYNNTRSDVQFSLAAADGLNVFIGEGAVHYQFSRETRKQRAAPAIVSLPGMPEMPQSVTYAMYRMDVELLGANKRAPVVMTEEWPYVERHFTNGASGASARAYGRIVYKNVYPSIDWVLYVSNGKMKHEFVVHNGGRISDIKLRYSGATKLSIGPQGALTACTPEGEIIEQAPFTYANDGQEVYSRFRLDGDVVSYEVGDHTGGLTIDPTLAWATYYGGSAKDIGRYIETDAAGNIYFGGTTESASGIATSGAFHVTYAGGVQDAFLVKMSSSGSRIWATYFGGAGQDLPADIALDNWGNIYLAGYTSSTSGIASPGAYQASSAGGLDIFLAKFSNAGARIWSTFFGSDMADHVTNIAIDGSGDPVISGGTQSASGMATTGAHQEVYGGGLDAPLAKFDSSGSLQWATYYGGSGADGSTVLQLNGGNIYIAGFTNSTTGIATSGTHQPALAGGWDAYIAKFDGSGARAWGTYYGGAGDELSVALYTDNAANIFLGGYSTSTSGVATAGAYQTTVNGTADAYLARFDPSGTRQWCTYFGGENLEGVNSVRDDAAGNIYIYGTTSSTTSIATPSSYQPAYGGGDADAYLVKFNSTGMPQWATYFGGSEGDQAGTMALDNSGNIIITGETRSSSGIASASVYQGTYAGATDAFVAKFLADVVTAYALCAGKTLSLVAPATGGVWSSSNTAVATVNASTGVVSGISAGTANILYTAGGTVYIVGLVTVSSPITTISGAATVCVGRTTTFTHPVPGGTWSSSSTAIAAVDTFGVVTGIAAGTATITYEVGACFRTRAITVVPGTGTISGSTNICAGSTTTLVYSAPGTTWLSSDPSVATIGATSGLVTGISAGTTVMSFIGATGCAGTTVTVMPLPTAISGALTVCQGATTGLASAGTTGGTWASSNTAKAVVGSASGVVTGVNGGTANITYTWTNGCKRVATTTVGPLPVAGAIVGAGIVHVGSSVTLTPSSTGGTWASSNAAIATVTPGSGSTCSLAGVSAGSVVITYTNTNGCGTASVTRIFSVVFPRPGIAAPQDNMDGRFGLYPNPTSGLVSVRADVQGVLTMHTIDGRQISSYAIAAPATAVVLPDDLAAGIYLCWFSGDDGSTVITRLVVAP